MRLLVVEDNAVQRCIIQSMLADGNTSIQSVGTAKDFRDLYGEDEFDALVIDLTLPDGDGLVLIEQLRADYDSTPIIVISGRSKLVDKVKCLDAGADDYLVKPFSHVELKARVNAVTRRSFRIRGSTIRAGNLFIDERAKLVTCGESRVDLAPSEFKLLLLMTRSMGLEVSRESIGSILRGKRGEYCSNSIEKLVSRLRTVLASIEAGVVVRTIRGGGYCIDACSVSDGPLVPGRR